MDGLQAPRSVLTRATAPEVLARDDENLRTSVRIPVEHKVRIFPRDRIAAKRCEQTASETSALQSFAELRGDNCIRVDIVEVQWGSDPLHDCQLLRGYWCGYMRSLRDPHHACIRSRGLRIRGRTRLCINSVRSDDT